MAKRIAAEPIEAETAAEPDEYRTGSSAPADHRTLEKALGGQIRPAQAKT